jgi:hypothetical protein
MLRRRLLVTFSCAIASVCLSFFAIVNGFLSDSAASHAFAIIAYWPSAVFGSDRFPTWFTTRNVIINAFTYAAIGFLLALLSEMRNRQHSKSIRAVSPVIHPRFKKLIWLAALWGAVVEVSALILCRFQGISSSTCQCFSYLAWWPTLLAHLPGSIYQDEVLKMGFNILVWTVLGFALALWFSHRAAVSKS